MWKSVRRLVLIAAVAVLALPALAGTGLAEEIAVPAEDAAQAAQEGPALECAAEPVSGSGPGFSSSREASEDAAVEGWLEKAKAIYPEASWATAKDAGVSCAVQGLYSKCFALGIPCRPQADGAGTAAAAPESAAPGEGAEAPKVE
jgi:hypothetical protein